MTGTLTPTARCAVSDAINSPVTPIRLGFQNKDQRVLVEDGKKKLLWTVDQVLKACREYNSAVELADVDAQVRALWEVLGEWFAAREGAVESAFLHTGARGRLLFLVVQKVARFDRALTDSLTELDLDVANDDRFKLLKVSVRLVPPADQEQLDALLTQP
jgi:hypothetical protein